MTTKFTIGDIVLDTRKGVIVTVLDVSSDGERVYTNTGATIAVTELAVLKNPGYLRELVAEIAYLRRELHDATSARVVIDGNTYMCSPALCKAYDAVSLELSRMCSYVHNYQHREKNMLRDIDDARASLGVVLEKLGRTRGYVSAALLQVDRGSATDAIKNIVTILEEAEKI